MQVFGLPLASLASAALKGDMQVGSHQRAFGFHRSAVAAIWEIMLHCVLLVDFVFTIAQQCALKKQVVEALLMHSMGADSLITLEHSAAFG